MDLDLTSVTRSLGSDWDYYDRVGVDDSDSDGYADFRFVETPRPVRASLHSELPERFHTKIGESTEFRYAASIPHDQNVRQGGVLIVVDPNSGREEPMKLTRPEHAFQNSLSWWLLVEAESDPRDTSETGGSDSGSTGDDGFRVIE